MKTEHVWNYKENPQGIKRALKSFSAQPWLAHGSHSAKSHADGEGQIENDLS